MIIEKEIKVPSVLLRIAKAVRREGGNLFIVGGFVRNALLGYAKSDCDLTGNFLPEKMREICDGLGLKTQIINKKLGTVQIQGGKHTFEYTTLRSEYYEQGGKHSPESVEFVNDVGTDAARRDFTVNALYYNPLERVIHDYFGGLGDLEKRLLKCVVTPEHVFKNDGLRLLRFVRFACQLGFSYDKQTFRQAKKQVHLLKDISKSRMLGELVQILKSDLAYNAGKTSLKKAIKSFNELQIYGCFFSINFTKISLNTNSKFFEALSVSGENERLNVFICWVLNTRFKGEITTEANVVFVVNSLLGSGGLNVSRASINKVINTYLLVQHFLNETSFMREFVAQFALLEQSQKVLLNALNTKKFNILEKNVSALVSANVPFSIEELRVSNAELIAAGIENKKLTKIKHVLFSHALNQVVENEKQELIKLAKIINKAIK